MCSVLMSKIFDTIPDGITEHDLPYIIVLCLVTCKEEVPRSKGNTSEVSVKGTPILKLVRGIDKQAKKQSLGKAN